MKTCSRWRSRARVTSGLYPTENSGGSNFGSEDIGAGLGSELAVGASTVMSEIASEVLSDILGMELEIAELDGRPEPAISLTARREGSRC